MLIRYNIVIILLLILAFTFAGIIGFDVSWGRYSVDDLNDMWLQKVNFGFVAIFSSLAAIIGLLFVLKVLKRWLGFINFSSQKNSFLYTDNLSKIGLNRIWVYNILEAIIYLLIGMSVYWLTTYAWPITAVCFIMVAEMIIFNLLNRANYKFGIGKNGIVLLTRDLTTIPLSNLSKVEKDFNELFFSYPNGAVKKVPLAYLSTEQKVKLVNTIKDLTLDKGVFFDDNLN